MNKTDHYLYSTWSHMNGRCYNPNSPAFCYYGARGIFVCQEWRHDFWQFVDDMGERPLNHTLDRVDNNGPYAPDNCRWATLSEQQQNKNPFSRDPHQFITGPEHIENMRKARVGLPNRWCCG